MKYARGFTLIEILLATALLAGGLTLAFVSLRSATAVTQRGELIAQRDEQIRDIEQFLRRRLAGTLPQSMGLDEVKQRQMIFIGHAQSMRFASEVPPYLGRGGPYVHELKVVNKPRGLTLQMTLAMLLGGHVVTESTAQKPESLIDGLRSIRFRYLGFDQTGKGGLGSWQDDWQTEDKLPVLIQINCEDQWGGWPPLTIEVRAAARMESGL